ncbi:Multi-pass transmembrane protein, related [Eimeria maxima]|uniref:Multi-pass transmembrane protein, related n=1 Tax=Eimeria maxima TaxID=5804 RepID=U6M7G4_EIMMA|nr:Multi-pass transmembrane protein, related [Eimeria maxima]CDJ59003.1 Multi-pass transmembrane protein, related [Eimeria maxima]
MSYLLQPFSLGTNESIEDTFIAPPDNIQESRDAMEEAERRLLYDDFQKCGILPESILTLPELLARLRTSARHYDEEMLRRIYAALSSFRGLREPCTTGRVFIEAYMKRRRELLAVLESARGELDGAEMMLQQAEAHLSSLSMDPNAALAEESKLTAQVACLQSLDSGSPAASEGDVFKVHLECQQQVIETAAVQVERGVCFFNEVFSFEISSRDGDLRLCLIKVDPNSGREELVGDCSVLLQDLSDQKKREFVKEIWGHAGEIVLSCQWIFSKRALYEQYLHEFTIRREAKIRELSDYQEELDKLNRPFCMVDSGGGGLLNCVKIIPELLSRQLEDLREYLKLPGWMLTSQYAVALTVLLSSVAGHSRAVYLDQCIAAFLFWNNLNPIRWTLGRYSFLMISCIMSASSVSIPEH